jgi:hypothetical protein
MRRCIGCGRRPAAEERHVGDGQSMVGINQLRLSLARSRVAQPHRQAATDFRAFFVNNYSWCRIKENPLGRT